MFEEEKQRQLSLIPYVEKIEVHYKGQPEDCTLIMNKNFSTPFNCAMHVQELLMTRSAIAMVNGKPWDMHRPLSDNCELRFVHFEEEDPTHANNAFWRSCSFILGHVLETAFRDHVYVQLCSFPPPNLRTGSFLYDVHLGIKWKPSPTQLDALSREGYRVYFKDWRFERLDIDAALAQKMFQDNRFKSMQIPSIAAKSESGSTVTVYRMGDHVDLTHGPLVSSTSQLGRFTVTAFHDIESSTYGPLIRVQGTALPTQLFTKMHVWTYDNIISKRSKKLNPAPIPELKVSQTEVKSVP